jgi:hypothetical protein
MANPPAPDPYQTALSEYGAVAVFAQSNPEVNAKLQQAINEKWDAARFERELWTTNWYKTNTEQQRQLQVMQATDPAKYEQTIENKATSLRTMAYAMGKQVDQASVRQLAISAIAGGYDDATLQHWIGDWTNVQKDGRLTGQAGELENHVRSTYAAYGLPITDQAVQQQVNDVLFGRQTTGGLDNQIIAQASKLYPSTRRTSPKAARCPRWRSRSCSRWADVGNRPVTVST